ncbi:MAG TPA: hypothetical protein VLE93_02795 [Candidatus Saccharimonadales bacterium]|nr:hypothetical protein [Candidatus Saccharimonadales bacterium]
MDSANSEYMVLRGEITARAKTAHDVLNVATVLSFLAVAVGFVAQWFGELQTFLLFLPVVFGFLTFNYQTNQWTLFALARYLRDQSSSKSMAVGWENYVVAERAKSHHLLSFLALLPLILPLLLPLFVWWLYGDSASTLDTALTTIDLIILALAIFNFRYLLKK